MHHFVESAFIWKHLQRYQLFFANPNFGLFSNGSLIIESSKSNQRAFYGITQEGKPYFENNEYSISFNAPSGKTRNEAENFVITINDGTYREYLLSILKSYGLTCKMIFSMLFEEKSYSEGYFKEENIDKYLKFRTKNIESYYTSLNRYKKDARRFFPRLFALPFILVINRKKFQI